MQKKALPKRRGGFRAAKLVSVASKKRFLEVSPKFYSKHKSILFPAYKIILKNVSALSKAQVVREKGLVISPLTTGSNKGAYNRLSLRVDYAGETFFVKLGSHTATETSVAYAMARDYLASIGHRIGEFKVKLVNYRLLYNPRDSSTLKGSHRGVLVSDFMSSDRYVMLEDLQKQMGSKWLDSPIARAYTTLRSNFAQRGLLDNALKNVFYDPKTKTFQVFDLKTDGGSS